MILSEKPIKTKYLDGVEYSIPLEVGQRAFDKYKGYDRDRWCIAKLQQYGKPVLSNTYLNKVYRRDRLMGFKIFTYNYTEAAKKS